jgi:hypothetical protein
MSDPDIRASRQVTAQHATSVRLWHFPKPTLALLNGPAVGAGLALALACDLRYASTEATLRTGFIKVGLAGDFESGGTSASWAARNSERPWPLGRTAFPRAPLDRQETLRPDRARRTGSPNRRRSPRGIARRSHSNPPVSGQDRR